MNKMNSFNVVVIGVIFDPAKKKILIGKREHDSYFPELKWCFPSGRLNNGDEVDKALKDHIKKKTGYEVKNLGSIFTKTYPEKENLVAIYFLCEAVGGEEKAAEDLVELKWVSPDEIEEIFNTSFNSRLKEYLISLK